MKKTLIFADGSIAKCFLETILDKYFSNGNYIVIAKDKSFIPSKIPSTFEFHIFDYTSAYRASSLIDEHITDVFIIIDDEGELCAVYDIVRALSKTSRIILKIKSSKRTKAMNLDNHLIFIDPEVSIANKHIEHLPNTPLIPRNFGLGEGEIMLVHVPVGSIFSYRHIGSIQQKKWRIVGLYRHGEFILSSHSLIIQPNDRLLMAGEAKILNDIHNLIKGDIGQFPAPFGRDIALYVDMSLSNEYRICNDVESALFLNQKLKNNKLFIRILHPSSFDLLDKINALKSASIDVFVDYDNLSFVKRLSLDAQKRFGLVIVSADIFTHRRHRRALFNMGVPVLKTGYESVKNCEKSFVILSENMGDTDNVASVVFDISRQLELQIDIYDFEQDAAYHNEIAKSYEELSRIFERNINMIQSNAKNPINYIQDSFLPYLCFIPFERNIAHTRAASFFSTDVYKIQSMNNKNPQIFIPLPKESK